MEEPSAAEREEKLASHEGALSPDLDVIRLRSPCLHDSALTCEWCATVVTAEWSAIEDAITLTARCRLHDPEVVCTVEFGNLLARRTYGRTREQTLFPEQWAANDALVAAAVADKEGCVHVTAEMVAAAREAAP